MYKNVEHRIDSPYKQYSTIQLINEYKRINNQITPDLGFESSIEELNHNDSCKYQLELITENFSPELIKLLKLNHI